MEFSWRSDASIVMKCWRKKTSDIDEPVTSDDDQVMTTNFLSDICYDEFLPEMMFFLLLMISFTVASTNDDDDDVDDADRRIPLLVKGEC